MEERQVIFFPYFFFTYFFPVLFSPILFFPVLFSRTFSNVATLEIQHSKISVSCFSSTCRYITVHVLCGIAIKTSPVGLPQDGGKSTGKNMGKKYGKKSTGEKSRYFRWRHFRSRDCRQFLSLPVAPHRSFANTNLSVPIYYCSDHFVKTTRTTFPGRLGIS